jgi:hypothetical protein
VSSGAVPKRADVVVQYAEIAEENAPQDIYDEPLRRSNDPEHIAVLVFAEVDHTAMAI